MNKSFLMNRVFYDMTKCYKNVISSPSYKYGSRKRALECTLPSYIKCRQCSHLNSIIEVKDGYVIVCWDDSGNRKQCGKCVNEHTSMSSLMECGRFRSR